MEKNYKRLFEVLGETNVIPSPSLRSKILMAVEEAQQARERRFMVLDFSLLFASLGILAFAIKNLITEFSASGFSAYLSLVFSNASAVLPFWHEFLLSLAESLPIVATALFFFALFAVLFSLRKISTLKINRRLAFHRI